MRVDLINAVEKRKEPTVVVFYGDHLPTMGLEGRGLKEAGISITQTM